MPHRCFVTMCTSGYASNSEKVSMYKPPAGEVEQWNKVIPRPDRSLTIKDHVCEKHFLDSDIIREWISKDGATRVPHKVPRLKKGAVPCIFPYYPEFNLIKTSKRKKGVVNLNRTAKLPKVENQDKVINDGEMSSSESKPFPFEFVECA